MSNDILFLLYALKTNIVTDNNCQGQCHTSNEPHLLDAHFFTQPNNCRFGISFIER